MWFTKARALVILGGCTEPKGSMERCGRSSTDTNSNKVREPWGYSQVGKGDSTPCSGLIGGFLWPPRSYTCSFCKREFRSAQALGGHMNVHRRDRARLRQSPPWDPSLSNPNPNPNLPAGTFIPNLNVSPSSTAGDPKLSPRTHRFPSLLSPLTHFSSSSSSTYSAELFCPRGGDLKGMETVKGFYGVEELTDIVEEGMDDVLGKERGLVRLDLEIGTCGDSEKDDLDLELRLGYT